MSKLNELETRRLSPKSKRLLKEWKQIDKLCKNNRHISYIIRKRNPEGLPVKYEIIYKDINSIIGVQEPETVEIQTRNGPVKKEVRKPVYGRQHIMEIVLPNNFPSARGNPEIYFKTDLWHPNVRYSGKYKGRVCTNEKDLGITTSLAARIIRMGQYLQYHLYHALIHVKPHPEDNEVAEWVTEEAEPIGWVNKYEGIFTDNVNLYQKVKPKEKTTPPSGDRERNMSGESPAYGSEKPGTVVIQKKQNPEKKDGQQGENTGNEKNSPASGNNKSGGRGPDRPTLKIPGSG